MVTIFATKKMENWFESWFDTKYYHILYKDRDHSEAEFFMEKLSKNIDVQPNNKVLDLACGKGRHATFLNSLGFDVVGVDLSKSSISSAKSSENKKLNFFVHDMRKPILGLKFDYVFNLFTSIGYFDDENDNIEMLESIHSYLNKDGILVIDFLNETKVRAELENSAMKRIEGIDFYIRKEIIDGVIVKTITFSDDGKDFEFQERVHALTLEDFRKFLSAAKFEITQLAGDYHLSEFDKENSDRLIIFAKKR